METVMSESGITRIPGISNIGNFDWNGASSALALRSSGEVTVLIGSTPWPGSQICTVWYRFMLSKPDILIGVTF